MNAPDDEMLALLGAMTNEQLADWMNLIAGEMQRRRKAHGLVLVK